MARNNGQVQPRLEPGSPAEPVEFGKYYLLGLIARGGMAEVYRARLRDGDGTLFAIKVMRAQLARQPRFVDMFRREAQLAMLLVSPAIVRTFEVGQIAGRHYIAMEYIAGCDLTRLLRKCQKTGSRIPVPHAVYIAMRIAEALDFAHNLTDASGRPLNLVNRDVSPSNVRLSYDGDVKMLDFGIAQALMKFTSEIGVLKGKFSYMSPEQIRGMPLDARSDIFSAGIILHEVLTTEKLFRGDTEFALMEKVRKAEVAPPSAFNRRVPPELDRIALRALGRSVEERYQTAADLASDLRAVLDGYRFQPAELQQFLRQLFRAEYARERADQELARTSMPSLGAGDSIADEPTGPHGAVEPPATAGPPPPGPPPSGPPPPVPAAEPRGLLARWRRRKKR
ncbi:MAG: serine/threonine protein kinase [Deltaproteobacteria bacterium]|nr:MAG: serine/threonine protein kinase [Deltaproteobacteria bacterium]